MKKLERTLAPADFRYLQGLLREATGVVLDEGKQCLVAGRLGNLCYQRGVDLGGLVAEVKRDDALRVEVLDLLLNHETSFFRDWKPFEGIRHHLLSDLCAAAERRGERTLRIWCSACSTGQEPYSVAMLLRDHLDLDRWNVEITASDVSAPTLERAEAGRYSAVDVNRGLPSQALLRHFEQTGIRWRVRNEVRELVSFKRINLIEAWPTLPPFDLVLLRNVLIYFDRDTRAGIFERLLGVLRPGAYLLVGSAEMTMKLTQQLRCRRVDGATYFQRDGAS